MKKTLFVGSLCFLLAGAGLKPASAPVSAETPSGVNKQSVTDSTQTTSSMVQTQTRVELLGTGSEPRQELRLKPAVNTKQMLAITMNMDMTSSVSGQTMPKFKVPASVMKLEGTVTQVDPNGDIHYQVSYTDADVVADSSVQPELANMMRSVLKKIVGLKSSYVIDNRGQIKSGSVTLPEGTDPMTKQLSQQLVNSLSQLSTPIPAEAIGVGAKWRASSSLDITGVKLSQNALFELVNRQGNAVTLKIDLDQQGQLQNLPVPGLPAGANLTLKSLKSQGQGQMTISPDAIMPTQANMSILTNSEMNVKPASNREETTISTQLAMQMSIEPQK